MCNLPCPFPFFNKFVQITQATDYIIINVSFGLSKQCTISNVQTNPVYKSNNRLLDLKNNRERQLQKLIVDRSVRENNLTCFLIC